MEGIRSRRSFLHPAPASRPQISKPQNKIKSLRMWTLSTVVVVTLILLATSRRQRSSLGWELWGAFGYAHSSIALGKRHQAGPEEIQYHAHLFESLLQERAINNEIILTVATFDYLELVLNLVCSFRQANVSNFVIGALDNPTFTTMKNMGLPVYSIYPMSALGGVEIRSGVISSRNFNKANIAKHEAVIRALEIGYRVVSTDSDIFWLRNPLSYLRTRAGSKYDIVFQCDSPLADPTCRLCAGFYYANSTPYAIKTFKWLVSTKLKHPFMRDQPPLRKFLCYHRLSNDSCLAANNGPIIAMLSRTLFPAGFAVSEFGDDVDVKTIKSWNPYILHFNWNDGGHVQKIQLMKKLGFWLLNSTKQCDKMV